MTLNSTATGLTADEGVVLRSAATLGSDTADDIAEYGGTVVFNGPLTLHSTATGLTADGSNITVLVGDAVLMTADGVAAFNEGTIL